MCLAQMQAKDTMTSNKVALTGHALKLYQKAQGAIVLDAIEDLDQGHGALVLNAKNARRVLDLFLKGTIE